MFKPKKSQQQQQSSQQQQPFYLSWFTSQGENLKRGGTAPQQSRKERLQLKSPYQQPLTTVIHVAPNPYAKTISVPKPNSNIQQISKIYAQKPQLSKRKSQEYERQRYDIKSTSLQSRAFTQQGMRPLRFSDGRPQTQQLLIENKNNSPDNLTDDEQNEQLTPRDQIEIIQIDNNPENLQQQQQQQQYIDGFSNESNDADSEDHQNFQIPQDDEQQIKNKSYIKEEQPIENLRKTNNQLNRPQTSEGGRRKRFMNSFNQSEQNYEKKKETEFDLLEFQENIIKEEYENYEMIDINPIISPKQELLSIRSGQRRKQQNNDIIDLDLYKQLNSTLNNNNNNVEDRPPSRHKTPPKATGLELPLNSGINTIEREGIIIPIKNMYAQIDNDNEIKKDIIDVDDDLDLDFFKMNNKRVNLKKFQQKEIQGYHTDDQCVQQKHPKSANVKQNQLYSPLNSQITSAHLRNEAQIVIKYNNSSAIQRSDQPIKVPFKTKLDQDFLRLFANNDYID